MEIHQARAFLAVAREGSFSRAAQKIGRTQPTVTMSVQKLERELKETLFERSGRTVRLTPRGQLLAETIGPLLEAWANAADRAREGSDGVPRGPVRVGAGEVAVLYLLPAALRRFRRANPHVQIVVRHQAAGETLAMLRRAELDFGLLSLPAVPDDLDYRPLVESDRVLIAPPGHPLASVRAITLEKLARYEFIVPWPGSTTRMLIEGAFARRGLALRVALEAGGWEIVKRYVLLGLGVAVVPELCVESADRRKLAYRSVSRLFGRDAYGIATRRGRELSVAAKALIDQIADRSAAENGSHRGSTSRG
jgi:DNA-binding transcriptional LysR family regulator